ncbi:hypothetical protein KQH49_03130 [Mycetohabitans sp. B5]|uniref:Uncharacterized protein n=1 Tax=Mycetohabitans endofungorum TaxID=417203 RepID=A0A2P5KER2_9BURK|nr:MULTISPECIES: hypothetical protein [Mycetohabitans]MCG1054010.1 hypothetical protein [Mycetohabitans sp. B5]PPB85180.1 hypothetical protein B0O95_101273 [Mycetohabitans endofungorum]
MGSPSAVAPLRTHPSHPFGLDDLSLLDADHVDANRRLSAAQLTNTYLLALARTHKGKLASFDRGHVVYTGPHGAQHLELIG